MSKLNEIAALGQSIWLDYIERGFITSGQLKKWIDRGLRGITSNPTIFQKAIANTEDYNLTIQSGLDENKSADHIYEDIILEDIALAADLLKIVHDNTAGLDGYVSLEVNPGLAHDTQGTIDEVLRYHEYLNRPNVMFKVPATREGIPAIATLTGKGIPVNITLIFSFDQYVHVAEAYLKGLEQLFKDQKDLSPAASVASFFVSRVDGKIDPQLAQHNNKSLQGEIAILNVKKAYQHYLKLIETDRWKLLAKHGARPQRLLWASTSTKNPDDKDTMYVDSLIGKDTVNTLPLATLEAFIDHGTIKKTITDDAEKIESQLDKLLALGISLKDVTDELLDEGVTSFKKSYDDLIACIIEKSKHLN